MDGTGGGRPGKWWRRMQGTGDGRRCSRLLVPLAAVLVLGTLFFLRPALFYVLELKLLDEQFRLRGPRAPAARVEIVAIDDASLERVGRWPWPRATLARLVERLRATGAKVIGADLILSEPELSLAHRLAAEIEQRPPVALDPRRADALAGELRALAPLGDPDRLLAAAMEGAPLVLAAYFSLGARASGPPPATPLAKFGFLRLRGKDQPAILLPRAAQVTEPMPPLAGASAALGHVNILPDPDGTVRRETPAVAFGERFYPSLALQVARIALDVPPDQLLLDFEGSVQVGGRTIPTDVEGRMLLDYAGPEKSFPRTSAADVLAGTIVAGRFSGAVVLVGATATGIFDLRVTPFSSVLPGVEIHANTIENILAGRFLAQPAWVELLVFLLVLVIPFALAASLARLRPAAGAVLAIGVLAGLAVLAQALFVYAGIWLPVFYPMLAAGATYVPITIHRALTEERQRLFLKRAFQQYVPGSVVNQIVADPSLLRFGGERRELTILFSDIRSFTTYAERHPPEAVVETLREYLTCMVAVLFRHDGTLDKFIGDAVMAIFGAPLRQADHALRACRTALDMRTELGRLQEAWRRAGREPFEIGIGINTGEVIVGNLGSEQRFDYTGIGDPVNVAARLESLNKEFPEASGILISERTYELAQDHVQVRLVGEIKVKGKIQPVLVYELLGMRER